jgi:hypothetical protein
MTQERLNLIAFDLYWLRCRKQGQQWYELTDYIREKLVEDGHEVKYGKNFVEVDGVRMTGPITKKLYQKEDGSYGIELIPDKEL